ncbi:hypothetical protein LTR56_014809 [Elasticomyces elasticus]|nr:hypothetical protein LTR56_014809 [Elasticomyces elasticus]KAK3644731.1 hypothetical protein LTR22_015106 [Elasticomyces elasticus]KAK4916116.1 hypothetical protein LTR49_015890 [Elasticomyces elasticus]KAK5755144.1 hypothetical protein LTS12_014708 [Elasticomyces elasticus]
MAGKKAAGENGKKASGNAQKAESAAQKKAAENAKTQQAEAADWGKGAKDNSKAAAAAAKAEEAARKKAEKDALRAEEEASLPTKPTKGKDKAPAKKTRGLDLSQLDESSDSTPKSAAALNASGIDNALDALQLTSGAQDKIDKHPERRFPAAYKAYEERRLDEMKDEKGLRRQQRIDLIRKEFEKHPDNPFNQVAGRYDMSKEELKDLKESERERKEGLLTGS